MKSARPAGEWAMRSCRLERVRTERRRAGASRKSLTTRFAGWAKLWQQMERPGNWKGSSALIACTHNGASHLSRRRLRPHQVAHKIIISPARCICGELCGMSGSRQINEVEIFISFDQRVKKLIG